MNDISLPCDLGRAISLVGLGQNQLALFWHVMEASPVPCPIDCAALAATWDVHRHSVGGAKRWLIAARILEPADGGFVVNQQWIRWVEQDGHTPLLRGARLAYVEAGRDNSKVVARQRQSCRRDNSKVVSDNSKVVAATIPKLSRDNSKVVAPLEEQAHVRELPAAFNSLPDGEIQKQAGGIAPQASEAPAPLPHRCPVPDATWMILPGLNELPRAEAMAVLDEVWRCAESRSLCREWWAAQRRYTAKAWRYALAKLNRKGTVPQKVTLLAIVAAEWKPERVTGPALPPPDMQRPYTKAEMDEYREQNRRAADERRSKREAAQPKAIKKGATPEQIEAWFRECRREKDAIDAANYVKGSIYPPVIN